MEVEVDVDVPFEPLIRYVCIKAKWVRNRKLYAGLLETAILKYEEKSRITSITRNKQLLSFIVEKL